MYRASGSGSILGCCRGGSGIEYSTVVAVEAERD